MPSNLIYRYVEVAPEVADALASGQPVVALESTLVSHGMPYPRNIETASAAEQAVRDGGAVPATIAILGGRLTVGLSADELAHIGKHSQQVVKCSRRDLPFVIARQQDGATTVAATMIIAAMAGIRVFATGGIGGVHRGVNETMDISADLEELANSNVTVVCAGVKSILDVGRTLEYLETRGVPVVGYGTDTVPAFYCLDSGHPVDYRVDSALEAAAAIRVKRDLDLDGGMVVAVPIPAAHALSREDIDSVIDDAIAEMRRQHITGKATTPFLLARIAERTGGRSLEANVHLVVNNAGVAAAIAAACATSRDSGSR